MSESIDPCPICLQEIKENEHKESHIVSERVQHVFHENCLKEWFENSTGRRCPMCAVHIPESMLDNIKLLGKTLVLIPAMPLILTYLVAKDFFKMFK